MSVNGNLHFWLFGVNGDFVTPALLDFPTIGLQFALKFFCSHIVTPYGNVIT